MMITLDLLQLIGLLAMVTAVGFGFGSLAVWYSRGDEDPGPGQQQAGAPPPLPRAGYFPDEPLSLWSEHQAQLQAIGREINQMIEDAPQLSYDRDGYRWEGPY